MLSGEHAASIVASKCRFGNGQSVRVAILGAGFISDFHARALKSIPQVSLVAVCDSDFSKAEVLRARWDIPIAYGSLIALLKECNPDVIHILVPPPLHLESALACMESGSEVFVEKPITASVEEFHRLKNAANDLGRIVSVNHNAKYHPAFRQLIREISECGFGEVQHVTACVNVPLRQLTAGQHTHWMFQKPENIIFEQGPHPLAQIHHLLGDFRSVSAMASGQIELTTGKRFYQTWQISAVCERGTAQCHLSFGRGFPDLWLHVVGEDGTALVDLRRNTIRFSYKTRFMEPVDYLLDALRTGAMGATQGLRNVTDYSLALVGLKPQTDPFYQSMRESIRNFYQGFTSGASPRVDLDQASSVMRACGTIVESASASFATPKAGPHAGSA